MSLGGDEGQVAPALKCRAEHILGADVGVAVGGVEEVDAGFKADVEQAARFVDFGAAPGFEKLVGAAERSGAETESGDFEAGASEKTVFHRVLDAGSEAKMRR